MSVDLFSLLCDGNSEATSSGLGHLSRYGGPILYLFVYGFILFGILVWVDSGSIPPRRKSSPCKIQQASPADAPMHARVAHQDVDNEAAAVVKSQDALRVLNAVKAFGSSANRVVDNVSFGVSHDTIFALLGPNGAGKTTTFNMIRGPFTSDNACDIHLRGACRWGRHSRPR